MMIPHVGQEHLILDSREGPLAQNTSYQCWNSHHIKFKDVQLKILYVKGNLKESYFKSQIFVFRDFWVCPPPADIVTLWHLTNVPPPTPGGQSGSRCCHQTVLSISPRVRDEGNVRHCNCTLTTSPSYFTLHPLPCTQGQRWMGSLHSLGQTFSLLKTSHHQYFDSFPDSANFSLVKN